MPYSVYTLKSRDNRMHVGVTSSDVKRRWNNRNGYRFSPELWRTICEDGWGPLEKRVIADGLSIDDACALEQRLISAYRTTDSRFGYNREGGGINHRKIVPSDVRNRMGARQIGPKNHNYGKHFPIEHKHKLSESNRGQKRSALTCERIGKSKGIPVNQYSTDGTLVNTYASGRKASAATGIQAAHISKVCKRQQNTAGGFVWAYA